MMLLYALIASILIKNVHFFDANNWQWKVTNALVKKGEVIPTEKEPKANYTINGANCYMFPVNYDIAVFLYGSPGGNVWEDEFIPEVQSKARKTLLYSGTYHYGILGAWENEEDKNIGSALGPWIFYPGSPQVTPYKLEMWNPFVFLSFKLNSRNDIDSLLEKLSGSDALGVILPLPDDSTFDEEKSLLMDLSSKLREKGLKIFGYSIYPVSNRVLNQLRPDVLIGWIPDSIAEGIKVLPLFFDTIPTPDYLVPLFYRISLEPRYSFHNVGIQNYDLILHINTHNEEKLREIPNSHLLFGSGGGFIGRYFGYAFVNTFKHWILSGIPADSVWKVILRNNRKVLNDSTGGFVLYADDPIKNPEVVLSPLLIIAGRNVVLPPYLEYQIENIMPGPLPVGLSDVIVDFSSDSTLWGSDWKHSNLGFGLTGKWDGNCFSGMLASDPQNLWMSGQVINLEKKFGQGWDMSIFRAIKIDFENKTVPVEISLLTKFSYNSPKVNSDVNENSALIDLTEPYSRGIQAIRITPLKFGSGDYRICLKSVSVIRDSLYPERLANRLFERIESGYELGDTALILKAYRNLKIINAMTNEEDFRYLIAFANYRLISLVKSTKRKLELIKEALQNLSKVNNIEARILEFSLRGYEMGLSPLKAIFGGGKMNKLRKLLEEKAQDNPRAYLVMGISKLFTPPMYGGSVDRAIEYLTKSVNLFQQIGESEPPYSWGYADALIFLAIAYKKKGMHEKAVEAIQTVRKRFPYNTFGYIQYLTLK